MERRLVNQGVWRLLTYNLLLALLVMPRFASAQIQVRVRTGGRVLELPLERYVAGVLAGEGSIFRYEASLQAMSVAARTYAVRLRGRHAGEGFDFCDTTHCQRLVLEGVTARLNTAAAGTVGQLLWFEGKPAFTPYTRDCGGRTEDVGAIWPELRASYLTSREDRHRTDGWQWMADSDRVAAALRAQQLKTPRRVERIAIVQRTDSGRARTLALSGGAETVRLSASSFRFAVGRSLGWNTVLSDRYEIHDGLVFQGTGSGHGVGLCQLGAEEMGGRGSSWREILAFYYPGTTAGSTAGGLSWRRLGGDSVTLLTTRPDEDRDVLQVIEQEARSVSNRVRLTLPGGVEIRVYPDVDSFRNVTGEPGWVAAYTSGRSIHLQPSRILRKRNVLRQTVRHELLHVLVESEAKPGLPLWFREGLIEYLERRPGAGGQAPADTELRQTANAARARRAYAEASRAVSALARRYGETAVLGWLRTGLPEEVRNINSSQQLTKSK